MGKVGSFTAIIKYPSLPLDRVKLHRVAPVTVSVSEVPENLPPVHSITVNTKDSKFCCNDQNFLSRILHMYFIVSFAGVLTIFYFARETSPQKLHTAIIICSTEISYI